MNFQGRLLDSGGAPIAAVKAGIFKIFNVPSGGSALWTETQNVTPDANGIYNVILGTVTALNLDFNEPYYLEVSVGGETLTPRIPLTSSPYALRAATANAVSPLSITDAQIAALANIDASKIKLSGVSALLSSWQKLGFPDLIDGAKISGNILPGSHAAAHAAGGSDPLTPYVIVSTNSLQAGATFYVASGTVKTLYSEVLITKDPVVNVKWFGAKGDNTTDDTEAIKAAMYYAWGGDASFPSSPKPVYLPAGQYKITSTILIKEKMGITLMGDNMYSSFLNWYGDASSPLLRLCSVLYSDFFNFGINTDNGRPLTVAVQSEPACRTGVLRTAGNKWERVLIDGTNGGINKGFAFVQGAVSDGNNDLNIFIGVQVKNYLTAGVSFEHSQTKSHDFFSCFMMGNGFGKYGVAVGLNSGQGGSFRWYSGGTYAHTEADFLIGCNSEPIWISANDSEGSARFARTAGAPSCGQPINLIGNRWEGLKRTGYPVTAVNDNYQPIDPEDGVIDIRHRDNLILIGNHISGNDDVEGGRLPIRISLSRAPNPQDGGLGTMIAIGNTIGSSRQPDPFVAPYARTYFFGNQIYKKYTDGHIENTLLPDKFGASDFVSLVGISSTTTKAANLRGSASVAATATSAAATFGKAEADANYYIQLTPSWSAKCWYSAKATSGFTVNCDTSPGGSGGTVDWFLIR